MYKIRYIGDPVLRKKGKAVVEFDDKLKKLIEDMIEVMHREDGIGLAAPQIGISRQILVTDASELVEGEFPRAFINPVILKSSGTVVKEEGCLSIPSVREQVERPERILLRFQDEKGQVHEREYSDWMARILQHEIDHLNGILFIDYLSPIKRKLLINQNLIPAKY